MLGLPGRWTGPDLDAMLVQIQRDLFALGSRLAASG